MTLSRRERATLIAVALVLGLIAALLDRSIASPASEAVGYAPAAAWDAAPIARANPTPSPATSQAAPRDRSPLNALRAAFAWLRTTPASPPTPNAEDVTGPEVVPAISASLGANAPVRDRAGAHAAAAAPMASPPADRASALYSASMVQTDAPSPVPSPTP